MTLKSIVMTAVALCLIGGLQAQIKFNAAADVMNRYVWRGTDFGSSPSIQPTLSLGVGNFEIGYWGALSTMGNYNEVDLYAKYNYKGFSIMATDYFFPVSGTPEIKSQRYFNWSDETTGHAIEGALSYKNLDVMPFSFLAGVFVYAADKDIEGENRYSTYLEGTYTHTFGENTIDVFAGATLDEGMYGTSAGVINAGVTVYRNIKLTDSFTLPVKASVITNPQSSNIYFLFGFTL